MMLESVSFKSYVGFVAILANQICDPVVMLSNVCESMNHFFQFQLAPFHPTYHSSLDILVQTVHVRIQLIFVVMLLPANLTHKMLSFIVHSQFASEVVFCW